jgi:hypothetical protein
VRIVRNICRWHGNFRAMPRARRKDQPHNFSPDRQTVWTLGNGDGIQSSIRQQWIFFAAGKISQ